jgi:hypothetical protein
LSSTFTFPFPFNLDCVGSASRTFCVALVARRDGSPLACKVNGPGTSTLSLAGRRPTYSAAFYELQSEV